MKNWKKIAFSFFTGSMLVGVIMLPINENSNNFPEVNLKDPKPSPTTKVDFERTPTTSNFYGIELDLPQNQQSNKRSLNQTKNNKELIKGVFGYDYDNDEILPGAKDYKTFYTKSPEMKNYRDFFHILNRSEKPDWNGKLRNIKVNLAYNEKDPQANILLWTSLTHPLIYQAISKDVSFDLKWRHLYRKNYNYKKFRTDWEKCFRKALEIKINSEATSDDWILYPIKQYTLWDFQSSWHLANRYFIQNF